MVEAVNCQAAGPGGDAPYFGWRSQPGSPASSPRPPAVANAADSTGGSLDATMLPPEVPQPPGPQLHTSSQIPGERLTKLNMSIQQLNRSQDDISAHSSRKPSARGRPLDKKQSSGTLSSSQSTTATLSTTANSADVTVASGASWNPKFGSTSATPRTSSAKIPIQLKAMDAEPQYIALAERLQAGGAAALKAACRSQCFREAMAMQGLEPGDFMEATGLSQERQKRLLALVLQQQDRLLVEPPVEEAPRSARGASVLHRQIRERTDRSVERAWQTMQHRQTVGQRYTSELDARRVRQVERAQAQENKAERVRVRDQELTAQRRERETIRNNKWQDAINLAAELDVVRKQNLEAHHAANDARSRSAIANRDQERSMKCQQLRHQFQKVMDTAEWKKNDESRQACEKAEWLQQMMKKSDAHQEACRVAYEQRQDERRQTTREREHEVLRVMRMNNYIRQQRANEQQEESVMFEEYLRMRDALPQQVADKLDEKRASVTASLH